MSGTANPFTISIAYIALALAAGCAAPGLGLDVGRPLAGRRSEPIASPARLRSDVAALVEISRASGFEAMSGNRQLLVAPGKPASQSRKLTYLRSQLEPLGYELAEEPFDLPARFGAPPGFRGVNLLATKRGTTHPERILELGAHYDTANTPGADDNASGVAGVLEVARALAAVRTEKTLRLCFFDFEEFGLVGSTAHVERIKAAGERLEGIIVFEMIGYALQTPGSQRSPIKLPFLGIPTVGNFIAVLGNMKSGGLGIAFERAARRGTPPLPYYSFNRVAGFIPDAARSDHSPYWKAGYKAIMLTDTANFRNPHYHEATDTPETLDYEFLAQVVEATVRTLQQ